MKLPWKPKPSAPGPVDGETLAVIVELPGNSVAVPAVIDKAGALLFAPEIAPVLLLMLILESVTVGDVTLRMFGISRP